MHIRSFLSISSQRRTSFTNFLWKALTLGFSCKYQQQAKHHSVYFTDACQWEASLYSFGYHQRKFIGEILVDVIEIIYRIMPLHRIFHDFYLIR